MSSEQRYELVSNVSDNESSDQPPAYEHVAEINTDENSPSTSVPLLPPVAPSAPSPPFKNYDHIPPTYEAATTLPSYEDVQKTKEQEERRGVIEAIFNLHEREHNDGGLNIDGMNIGNDCSFFVAFLMGFFFNWIGLFIGYFIMFNLASRNGALAGFGVSLIKWLFFLKYSDCCKDYMVVDHQYIWWVLSFFGIVLLLKGTLGWLSIRKLQYMNLAEFGERD